MICLLPVQMSRVRKIVSTRTVDRYSAKGGLSYSYQLVGWVAMDGIYKITLRNPGMMYFYACHF